MEKKMSYITRLKERPIAIGTLASLNSNYSHWKSERTTLWARHIRRKPVLPHTSLEDPMEAFTKRPSQKKNWLMDLQKRLALSILLPPEGIPNNPGPRQPLLQLHLPDHLPVRMHGLNLFRLKRNLHMKNGTRFLRGFPRKIMVIKEIGRGGSGRGSSKAVNHYIACSVDISSLRSFNSRLLVVNKVL